MATAVRPLMAHQECAAAYADATTAPALFLEMRLGKTLVAIRWAEKLQDVRHVLVVAPLSTLESWKKELALEGIEMVKLVGTQAQRMKALEAGASKKWFGINYEALNEGGHVTAMGKRKAMPTPWATMPWDCVIADESTRIRNARSSTTKVFLDHMYDVKYRAILSGLPNPEGPEDVVTQLIWLRGELMGCRDFWSWRAAHMQQAGYDWILKNKSRAALHEYMHAETYVLSRQEAGIGNKKVRMVRTVVLPAKVMAAIAQAREEFAVGEDLTKNVLETITWQQRLTGGRYKDAALHHDAKIRELVDLLDGELKGEQVVVWCRFTDEVEAVAHALIKADVNAMSLHGETEHNSDRIAHFQEKRVRVLVAQPKCIQMGIDLSVSDTAIYYSNWLDYEVRAQSEDRIEHPKKSSPLLILDIVAEGTVDEDYVELLTEKRGESRQLLRKLITKWKAR